MELAESVSPAALKRVRKLYIPRTSSPKLLQVAYIFHAEQNCATLIMCTTEQLPDTQDPDRKTRMLHTPPASSHLEPESMSQKFQNVTAQITHWYDTESKGLQERETWASQGNAQP